MYLKHQRYKTSPIWKWKSVGIKEAVLPTVPCNQNTNHDKGCIISTYHYTRVYLKVSGLIR